jgi:hypothetical protein
MRLYYGDFHSNGTVALLEACHHHARGQYVPLRSLESVAAAFPGVRERFSTHSTFAEANVDQVLGEFAGSARMLEAGHPDSSVLMNRGNRFTVEPLPLEAQLAPAFGLCVSDFDGDSFEDIILCQNLNAVHPEDSPMASGTALWLRGDGTGHFTAVPPAQSGLRVHGEQRGCATADFDQDGRADLVIAQNGYETKLFRNTRAKRGLRVRLSGPPGNPMGVGTTIRVLYPNQAGPIREVHAGAGYWSQDSAAQVLGFRDIPVKIWVRWPGGRVTLSEVPEKASEIVVR